MLLLINVRQLNVNSKVFASFLLPPLIPICSLIVIVIKAVGIQ